MEKDIKIQLHELRLIKQQEIIKLDSIQQEARKLLYFRNMICDLPTCNDCANQDCGVKPRPGDLIRYNCHLHIKEAGDNA